MAAPKPRPINIAYRKNAKELASNIDYENAQISRVMARYWRKGKGIILGLIMSLRNLDIKKNSNKDRKESYLIQKNKKCTRLDKIRHSPFQEIYIVSLSRFCN